MQPIKWGTWGETLKLQARKVALLFCIVSVFIVATYQGCHKSYEIDESSFLKKLDSRYLLQLQDKINGSFVAFPDNKLEIVKDQNYNLIISDQKGADFTGKVEWIIKSIPSDVCRLISSEDVPLEAQLVCHEKATVGVNVNVKPGVTEAAPSEKLDLTMTVFDDSQLLEKGQALYSEHCLMCHNNDGSGIKKDKTADQIAAAIANPDYSSMYRTSKLKLLTATEIRSIAASLKTRVPEDTTRPVVSILRPTDQQGVQGTIQVDVDASDETKLKSVVLQVDMGIVVGEPLTSPPFSFNLDTKSLTNGNHTIKAIAEDEAGNKNTAIVVIKVDNTPPSVDNINPAVAFLAPLPGKDFNTNGNFLSRVSATDNVGVVGVKFFLDGVLMGSEDTAAPFEMPVNIASLTDQSSHLLKAEARDAANNKASVMVSFVVDRTGPQISITAPSNGATLASLVSVNLNVEDKQGIATTFIKVDGIVRGAEDKTAPYDLTLDTSVLTNGSHTLTAVARDLTGNESSQSITITVNNIDLYNVPENELAAMYPPTVANISEGKTLWTTSCASCHTAEKRGRTYAVLRTKIGSKSDIVAMKSIDMVSSNVYKIYLYLNNDLDTEKPVVSIAAPINGQQVSGTIAVQATATDNKSVSSVALQIDGINYGNALTAAPYTFNIDTKTLSNATHFLKVTAKDPSANEASVSISISVNNTVQTDAVAPTVTFIEPINNQFFNGALTVRANATDNVGVAGVKLSVDGIPLGSEDVTLPYEFSFNAANYSDGVHSFKLEGRDAAGNIGRATITVTVDRVVPQVAVSKPSAGQNISGVFSVEGTASDAMGVVGVQLQVDGVNAGAEDTVAPYVMSFDSTKLSNGNHTIKLIARDKAGNRSEAPVAIVVYNYDPYNVPEAELKAKYPATNENILAGKALAQTYNCAHCHDEKFKRNFTTLRQVIGSNSMVASMKSIDLVSADVYRIYLYLNFDLSGASSGVEQAQMLLGTRSYVASYFKNIFVSKAGNLPSDPTINNLIINLLLKQPGAMGGACQKHDITSVDDTCQAKIGETRDGSMLPSSNALRRGYISRACEEILSIDQGVINALEKAGLQVTLPVDRANVALLWDVFAPGRPIINDVITKLVSVGGVAALSTNLDRWRMVIFSICRSASTESF